MQPGEGFLLDVFELEATTDGYRLWAVDDPDPVDEVIALPEQRRVCMLRSGLRFRCNSLSDAEQKIATCRYLGLRLRRPLSGEDPEPCHLEDAGCLFR